MFWACWVVLGVHVAFLVTLKEVPDSCVFLCCTENTTSYGAGEQIRPNHIQSALFYYYLEPHLKSSFLLLS